MEKGEREDEGHGFQRHPLRKEYYVLYVRIKLSLRMNA
jgi:hypothetical protein